MSHKLSPKDLALYRVIDEVLHYVWDPIGVASVPQARDEYHSYLPQVFGLVRDGSTTDTIAQYLTRTTVERMGLTPRTEHDHEIAELLLEWKRVNDEQYT